METSTPLSIYMQCASLFFILAGVIGDILVIRFFLFLGYLCIFVNACLGSPLWPSVQQPGAIALDNLLWSIVGLYVHGSSFILFLRDETAARLDNDMEALWRLFYRTGGLSEKLFQTIVAPNVQVCEFKDGATIPTSDHFYIIYKGHALLEVIERKEVTKRRVVRSGEMFDLEHLGMFHKDSIFKRGKINVTSIGDTKLFCFRSSEITKIANHRFAKSIWQALLISNLSTVVKSYAENEKQRLATTESGYCNRVFAPLEDYELPNPKAAGSGKTLCHPIQHIIFATRRTFSAPFPLGGHPSGMRQTLLSPPPAYPPDEPSVDSMVGRVVREAWLADSVTKSIKYLHRKMSSRPTSELGDVHVDDMSIESADDAASPSA